MAELTLALEIGFRGHQAADGLPVDPWEDRHIFTASIYLCSLGLGVLDSLGNSSHDRAIALLGLLDPMAAHRFGSASFGVALNLELLAAKAECRRNFPGPCLRAWKVAQALAGVTGRPLDVHPALEGCTHLHLRTPTYSTPVQGAIITRAGHLLYQGKP